jgi:anti-sigma-K factor RskA
VKLLLADRPDLAAHISRWGARVVELGAAHQSKGVLEVLSHAEVYAAWNQTKTGAAQAHAYALVPQAATAGPGPRSYRSS